MAEAKVRVILDTDIGDDIDDTWALAMALKCPEIDLKMVVSDTGDTVYRSQIVAKLLEVAGRTDVELGVGLKQRPHEPGGRQSAWTDGYDLAKYPGVVHDDGVQAMVDAIMASPEPTTLICIGPVPNIAKALEIEPAIAPRTNFVGMHGSIDRGYGDSPDPIPEWNVKCDVASCRAVFEAPWKSMTITPLDTCGMVQLTGEDYLTVIRSPDVTTKAMIDNYRAWVKADPNCGCDAEKASTTLFDTVAVHLAYSTEFLKMEEIGVRVADDGLTVRDESAQRMQVAIDWKDLEAYHRYLAERLVGENVSA